MPNVVDLPSLSDIELRNLQASANTLARTGTPLQRQESEHTLSEIEKETSRRIAALRSQLDKNASDDPETGPA